MVRKVPNRFLVAFSLAGEQRDLVRRIATEVERRLGDSSVFYDEWYEHFVAGANADLKLRSIYRDGAELVVVCISAAYGGKPWTQAEYEAIRARYMQATGSPNDQDRILTIRVGDGEVPGIEYTHIAPDVRERTISDTAQLIVDRLGLVMPVPGGSEPRELGWPSSQPSFSWPMADHTAAQSAFGALLTRDSAARILLVMGASDTGKTHLSKQMERNVAERLPAVRCGRLDFKGSTDRQIELEGFAHSLGFPHSLGTVAPQGDDLSSQLSVLVRAMETEPKPTVLIFDTYQEAGAATQWMERVFLGNLLRTEWLRVVLLGKDVPRSHEAIWQSVAADLVTLEIPGPADWFEYACQQRPQADITLEYVTKTHALSGGRPSVLSALFGRP